MRDIQKSKEKRREARSDDKKDDEKDDENDSRAEEDVKKRNERAVIVSSPIVVRISS